MGRLTKLTEHRQERIYTALREGNYFSTACEAAGVGESTAREWVARGEGRSVRPASAPYAAFAAGVKKARAEAEARALGQVRQAAADGTWQEAAWYLERAHPERWGRVRGDLVTLETVRQFMDELGGWSWAAWTRRHSTSSSPGCGRTAPNRTETACDGGQSRRSVAAGANAMSGKAWYGAALESNQPSRGLHGRTGFEDRLGHRARAAPLGT